MFEERDPRRALQMFVDKHRSAGESLEGLACKLGVSRIIEQRLPYEGGLFRLPDGELVIKLNAASSFARKRFTLAHEIGHLLLNTVPAFRSTQRIDEPLERTCDLIAAELLMPTEEALAFVRGIGAPTPEKLRMIASKFGVSLQVAARRVHDDFLLWKCSIGMWELSPIVRTSWFVGRRRWDDVKPDGYCFELAVASNTSVKTNDLWRRGPSSEPVWLNLLATGAGRVLGLVDFVSW